MLILLYLCYGVYLDGTAKKIMDRANDNLSVKPDYKGDCFIKYLYLYLFIYIFMNSSAKFPGHPS